MAETRTVKMLDRPPKRDVASLHARNTPAPAEDPPPRRLDSDPANDLYPIDTDIAIPKKPGKQGRVVTFPWERLGIGHSFFVPGEKSYKTGNFWCKWAMKEWPTKRFVYRKVEGGVRIWRVEAATK
jgi:hypothetical protein